jgi:hypothetical protein
MNHNFSIFILSFVLLFNTPASFGFETGIVRGSAKQEDIDAIINGLSFAGRDAGEIIFPEEANVEDLEIATKHYKKGIKLYDSMKYEEAEGLFKQAIHLFYKSLALPGAQKRAEETLFYLGAINVITQKPVEAEKRFHSLLELNENFEPDSTRFSPKIIEKFKTAKDNMPALPHYEINVCSPYTELIIDGSRYLKSPGVINLKKGRHTIINENERYFANFYITKNTMVFAGRISKEEFMNLGSDKGQKFAGQIGGLCGLKEVILVENSGGELVIKNYPLNNKINGTEIVNTNPERKMSSPFYKKWWFWTGVGVVVGSGAGIYILMDREDKKDSSSVVVKW